MTGIEEARTVGQSFVLVGDVQGDGVRPRVARLALQNKIRGWVRNSTAGVEGEVWGSAAEIDRFFDRLTDASDVDLNVADRRSLLEPIYCQASFTILPSRTAGSYRGTIPRDRVICAACLSEIFDPHNRRFGHAFNACARCGPRYSLLEGLPFDRQRTSMRDFSQCHACSREYSDPWDRRFHAQTLSCPSCGPRLWIEPAQTEDNVIEAAARLVRDGGLVAMKGIGGYQLIASAIDDRAIRRLREIKRRPRKPLAVMLQDLQTAERLVHLQPAQRSELNSPAGPIVLCQSRADSPLSPLLNPGRYELGILLPTSALHALLVRAVGSPVVVTSGNLPGAPIVYDVERASSQLTPLVDGLLHHDRRIVHPVDDSVVRAERNGRVVLRAARGLTPWPMGNAASKSCGATQSPALAVALGGHLKSASALSVGRWAVLGPYVGDLDSQESRDRFRSVERSLRKLVSNDHVVSVVHDAHPDYYTTLLAESGQLESEHDADPAARPIQTHRVFHHHAHILAAAWEHDWLDRPVLGFSWDGTGWGPDGSIWGGETLLVSGRTFRRVASLFPFGLVGGSLAVHQPWRVAVVLLAEAFAQTNAARERTKYDAILNQLAERWSLDAPKCGHVAGLRAASITPRCSAVGRLFDGVSAIVLGCAESTYEGESAAMLESVAVGRHSHDGACYPLSMRTGRPTLIDWRPMVRRIVDDVLAGQPVESIAQRFHLFLVDAIEANIESHPERPVVFSGGVFQNQCLRDLLVARLSTSHREFAFASQIPPGDGGLAAGQLAFLHAVPPEKTTDVSRDPGSSRSLD